MNRYIKSLIALFLIILLIVGVSLMPVSSGAGMENAGAESGQFTAVAGK